MRTGGRMSAAISVLDDVLSRRTPVNVAVRDWGKRARYAGAKDRAWISGLVLDALRRRNSLAHAMADNGAPRSDPRALVLAALRHAWNMPVRDIEQACYDQHGPTPLTEAERSALILAPDPGAALHVQGDFPEWLSAPMTRVFGEKAVIEAQAMTVRAPVDVRVNTLKADAEKAGKALQSAQARPLSLLGAAFRIPASDPSQRETSLQAIPAYSKGWVEVQDAGSQIAAAAANVRPGEQVLDLCAGGGGKTLALAAAMEGKGQVLAYDIDGRRLSALIPRLQRSGAHNVQLMHPRDANVLEPLRGDMDCVFVDAPCTGTGTWRRKPDTKWRVSEKALAARQAEQAEILETAAAFVKHGGRILYATCSFLMEEGEDQVSSFLRAHSDFQQEDAAEAAIESGLLTSEGAAVLRAHKEPGGAVRLTPHRADTDGFFFATLRRR
ncbi:MAG: RsmB/NOP family class I SAM-dependent RNA methyltransferase [Pseudomonadota bacterium]